MLTRSFRDLLTYFHIGKGSLCPILGDSLRGARHQLRTATRVDRGKARLGARMARLVVDDPDYPDRHILAPYIAAGMTGIPAHIAPDRSFSEHTFRNCIQGEENDYAQ